jgi:hypothetical protein
MRDAEPRDTVIFDDLGGTPDCGGVSDTPNHSGDADVGHDDYATLGFGKQDGVRYLHTY